MLSFERTTDLRRVCYRCMGAFRRLFRLGSSVVAKGFVNVVKTCQSRLFSRREKVGNTRQKI